ncbi:MAG: hypothetical protein H6797_01595 [Candidatus Nomurabacteria bacterium]|nr:MAG: hypothetical protein H6797_01595 [Candidatus Nomurabacteria bacterium]
MGEKKEISNDSGEFIVHLPPKQLVSNSYWQKELSPDPSKYIETYLGDQGTAHQENISYLASEFKREDTPLAPTCVLIPVAAHQESERIVPTMAEYAKQETDDPFSVVLYLNAPTTASYAEIRKAELAVARAKREFPHLDLRASKTHEYKNPVIGAIRKRLWDATMLLSHCEGLFEESGDVVGLNHDIDTEWMRRNFMHNVQKYYASYRSQNNAAGLNNYLKPAGTQLSHAYDSERPNISKVVFWYDYIHKHRTPYSTYEAGLVVPFSTYAKNNGFAEESQTYETRTMTARGLAAKIPGTHHKTSARRFTSRLPSVAVNSVWSNETFGANDDCRTENLPGDITPARAKNLIKNTLSDIFLSFFDQIIIDYQRGVGYLDFPARMTKQKNLAVAILERLDNTGELARYVDETFVISSMVKEVHSGRVPSVLIPT